MEKGRFTTQSNSGTSVQIVFPALRTPVTPITPIAMAVISSIWQQWIHGTSLHWLLVPFLSFYLGHPSVTYSTCSRPNLWPASSGLAEIRLETSCQPTEDLTLLWILFQMYMGSTKCFKRKSGWALERADTDTTINLMPRAHIKGIFSQTI